MEMHVKRINQKGRKTGGGKVFSFKQSLSANDDRAECQNEKVMSSFLKAQLARNAPRL